MIIDAITKNTISTCKTPFSLPKHSADPTRLYLEYYDLEYDQISRCIARHMSFSAHPFYVFV